ncbi:glycosyl hydrolase family 18 protein [Mycoplasmatota bacterium WC44]
MQIHVVKSGDTLYGISNLYSVPVGTLVEANEISNPNNLVVGQTIVIPIMGSYHFVQPGESLYSISNMYEIPVNMLMSVNNIQSVYELPVGYRLYIPQKPRTVIETSAYDDISLSGENSPKIISDIGDNLTYLPVFSYQVNSDGSINPLNDDATLIEAKKRNIAPLMVITNIMDGQFSTELATTILSSDELQDKLLDEVVKVMVEEEYYGLDVDFEYLGEENKERYVKFLDKANKRIKAQDPSYILSVALPPKVRSDQPGTLYEGHDYEAIGKIADKVFLMTYEWGWSGGPPMAVSPIDKVSKVMDYAISTIPKEKIYMGVPLYGYDWTLPYVEGGTWAKAIDQVKAYDIASKYGASIEYDEKAQTPFFTYTDEEGKEHEVWFEDARSYQAKFDYVKELGINGLFNWVLGFNSPHNWLLIVDNFVPVKLR